MENSQERVTVSEAPLKDASNDASAGTSAKAEVVQLRPNAFDENAWQVITLKQRLDGSNHSDLVSEIHEVLAQGARKIALDLSQNRFFSLNAIQFCMVVSHDLSLDGGAFALIGCAERTKRHFDIYGSLKQIRIARSIEELVTNDGSGSSVNIRLKQISQEAR